MADGSVAYYKDRYDSSVRRRKYKVWHCGPTGRRRSGKGPNDPLLYNLPAVLAAVAGGITIFLCEGEKDADALIARACVATTTANGAGSFPAEAAFLLAGAHVIVVLDRDPAGRSRASIIQDILRGHAASLRFVLPAAGKDAYDHIVLHGYESDDFTDTVPVRFSNRLPLPAAAEPIPATPGEPRTRGHRLAEKIRAERLAGIRSSTRGNRNITTFCAARYLLRLAEGGHFDHQAIEGQVEDAATAVGLPRWEIRATLRSAARAAKEEGPVHFRESRTWSDNRTDPFVQRVEVAIDRFAWHGKHGHHCRRVLLAMIEVLRRHHYPHSKFPASQYDIAHEANTKAMDSLRRALRTLQQTGWLRLVRNGTRTGCPSIWALSLPAQFHNDCAETTPFLDSSPGSYSHLRISHPAFLPMCWGFTAHQVLRSMTAATALKVREIATDLKLAGSTVRKSLSRLALFGVVRETDEGWLLTSRNLVEIADRAAIESGAASHSEALRSQLHLRRQSYRAFLAWKRTPPERRSPLETRTGVRLILEAA